MALIPLTKTSQTPFYNCKKQSFIRNNANKSKQCQIKFWKLNFKSGSVPMAYCKLIWSFVNSQTDISTPTYYLEKASVLDFILNANGEGIHDLINWE